MAIDIRLVPHDDLEKFVSPILTAFGSGASPDRLERLRRITELETRIAAFDGQQVVGSAGSFSFDMSTTGGRVVKTAGLTMVAVMPTHRRRGILRALMRRHLDEARAQGMPIAALWASEPVIYGRYGYGLSSFLGNVSIECNRSAFNGLTRQFEARFINDDEALAILPTLWDRARQLSPGMPSRSPSWWKERRLVDVESVRYGFGPLQRVVFSIDGRPEAYALYRIRLTHGSHGILSATVKVLEAIGTSAESTRVAWRYLCDIDLAEQLEASNLPVDHQLFMMMVDPRRLHHSTFDAVWTRIVDVESALGSRTYSSPESIVLEIDDSMCPWNNGRHRLDGATGHVHRTNEPADLRMPISSLGSAYFGGISFTRMADAGAVEAKSEGALDKADRIFRTSRAPWCPEIF